MQPNVKRIPNKIGVGKTSTESFITTKDVPQIKAAESNAIFAKKLLFVLFISVLHSVACYMSFYIASASCRCGS